MMGTAACAASLGLLLQLSAGTVSLQELVQRREWDAALRSGTDLVRSEPTNPHARYLLGAARWQAGDRVGAIQSFRAAERLGLSTAHFHLALGSSYYDANQFKLFRRQMERAIAVDAADPRPHLRMAQYELDIRNEFERALAGYERALEIAPRDPEGHFGRARCLELLQRVDEAKTGYMHAFEAGSGPAALGLARLLAATDPTAALEWARKAVAADDGDAEARRVEGEILMGLGRDEDALRSARRATGLDPDNPEAQFLLYRALRRAGRISESASVLERFKQLRAVYGDL